MISVKYRNEWFDMNPNASLALELASPLFDDGIQTGGFSYPFSIPATAKNKRMLGFPHLVEIRADISALEYTDVAVYYAGTVLVRGTAKLTQPIGGDSFNLYVVIGGFAAAVRDKQVNQDYTYGGTRTVADPATVEQWNNHVEDVIANPNSYDYVFAPVLNKGIEGATLTYAGVSDIVNHVVPTGEVGPSFANFYTPFPRLSYVLNHIFSSEGWHLLGEWLNLAEVKDLVFYTHVVKRVVFPFTVTGIGLAPVDPEIKLTHFLPKASVSDLLNGLRSMFGLAFAFDPHRRRCRVVAKRDALTATVYADWTAQAQPGYELSQDRQPEGYRFGIAWPSGDKMREGYLQYFLNTLIERNTILNKALIPWPFLSVFNPKDGVEDEAVFLQDPTNAVWDLRLATKSNIYYWCEHKGTAAAAYADSESWISISGANYVPTDIGLTFGGGTPPADYSRWRPIRANYLGELPNRTALYAMQVHTVPLDDSHPQYGDIYWLQEERCYVVWFVIVDLTPPTQKLRSLWLYLADSQLPDHVTGNGEREVRTLISTLIMADVNTQFVLPGDDPLNWRLPITKQPPVMVEERKPEDEVPMRLLLWRGAQDFYQGGATYPAVSSDTIWFHFDTDTTGEIGLHPDGEQGLWETWHADWAAFMARTKRVTVTVRLTLADLLALDFTRKVRLGQQTYLIGKVSVTLNHDRIEPAKVELYKL